LFILLAPKSQKEFLNLWMQLWSQFFLAPKLQRESYKWLQL
jgi:hypothetical protein